jgi:hypothetical protein
MCSYSSISQHFVLAFLITSFKGKFSKKTVEKKHPLVVNILYRLPTQIDYVFCLNIFNLSCNSDSSVFKLLEKCITKFDISVKEKKIRISDNLFYY